MSTADLAHSPDLYPHSFEGDDAIFVQMDRAAYGRSIFLDHRIQLAADGVTAIPVRRLADLPKPAPMGWIFHLAHCGSTLLARALDLPHANLVLREPLMLRQMGIALDGPKLDVALALLGRRYAAERPTIAKANVPVNFILPEIAARMPMARAVFLWCPLRDWLLAVLRSPGHRQWVRGVTQQLAHHLGDLSDLSDATCAAALWLAQMRVFEAAMAAWPDARSLEAERFFAEPALALSAAATQLVVPMSEAQSVDIAGGPLFATDAKRPAMKFDNAMRLARRAVLESELAPEIAQAQHWLNEKGAARMMLGSPLI